MSLLRPFAGQLIKPEWADRVVAPAYDSLSVEQRQAFRAANPHSYLHVTRAASDEPDGPDIATSTLVSRGRSSLAQLLARQAFAPAGAPALHVYRLANDEHSQLGVVAEVGASDFFARALPHEGVQPDRVDLLAEHFMVVGAASSPIAATVRDAAGLQQDLVTASVQTPVLDFASPDGLRQAVWRVNDPDLAASITHRVENAALYIVDGHHRAGANRTLLDQGRNLPVLAAVFPSAAMRILGFNRLVKLPNGVTEAAWLARIGRRFRVSTSVGSPLPDRGEVSVFLVDAWHTVHFDERPIAGPALITLGSLDPAVLDREILRPLNEPDGMLDVIYAPNVDRPEDLVVTSREQGRVPIIVPAVAIDEIMDVADAGLVMPPKSTYFTPKVRSGVFLRQFVGDELRSRK